jgi:hypothetical protein
MRKRSLNRAGFASLIGIATLFSPPYAGRRSLKRPRSKPSLSTR